MQLTQTIDGQVTEQSASGAGSELDLTSRVEALLFVADGPVSVTRMAEALQVGEGDVEEAVELLNLRCQGRGLRLQRQVGALQLTTAPQAAYDVERFLGLETSSRLSTAALETLALIAYRQPVTRGQVEAVRGVNCDGVLRTLLARGLVSPQGRLDQAGRPILYGTTCEFLEYFGLGELSQLPALESFRNQAVGGEPNAT